MPKAKFKYQAEFAQELISLWMDGKKETVRTKIRACINKEQAAYIAAFIAMYIGTQDAIEAESFVSFIHPNN